MSYLRRYFQDLFSSISAVAAMLPIMVTSNAINIGDHESSGFLKLAVNVDLSKEIDCFLD